MNSPRSIWVAAALWGALLLMCVAVTAETILTLRQRAINELAQIEPRFARLLGISAGRDRIAAAATETALDLRRHAYGPAQDASRAANDAQQRLSDLFGKSGLDVISMQVLPARQSPHFERISVSLRVEGDLQALQAALAALPSLSPSIYVEGFVLQSAASAENLPVRVVCELQLFALRAKS